MFSLLGNWNVFEIQWMLAQGTQQTQQTQIHRNKANTPNKASTANAQPSLQSTKYTSSYMKTV